ncbi:MAG: protein-tyrosine-phosphatase [Bacteroidota bacterium]
MQNNLFPKLQDYCQSLPEEFALIPADRQEKLKEIGDFILKHQKEETIAQLNIICTHNSRRSHMGMLWLKTAALYYGIEQVETFSGGTEGTAFNPRAVASLQRAGIEIKKEKDGDNPIYSVKMEAKMAPLKLFSKKYSHEMNPQKDFCAVMVCSDADEACPIVFGASKRVAIPYEDPKAFDNTDLEAQKYDERSRQIAREMFFVVNYVKEQL